MLESLREVVRYRSLLRDLVARDLKVRYKRSALGILWTMLNPLLLMIIFTIVFAHVLRETVEHFAVSFLSSYPLLNFFAQPTSSPPGCLVSQAAPIRQLSVPKPAFVLPALRA